MRLIKYQKFHFLCCHQVTMVEHHQATCFLSVTCSHGPNSFPRLHALQNQIACQVSPATIYPNEMHICSLFLAWQDEHGCKLYTSLWGGDLLKSMWDSVSAKLSINKWDKQCGGTTTRHKSVWWLLLHQCLTHNNVIWEYI